jgi:phospholipase/carboxylesterase
MKYPIQHNQILQYIIHKPDSMLGKDQPIIILLHGFGSNEHDLMNIASELPNQFIVISVRAPIQLDNNSFAWFQVNFNGSNRAINTAQEIESRELLQSFIQEISSGYNTKNITLIGFSQGAIMAYSLALTFPNIVSKIIAISGRILDEIKSEIVDSEDLLKLKVFVSHGTQDTVMPIHFADSAYNFLAEHKIPTKVQKYTVGHHITSQQINDINTFLTTN